MKKLTICYVLLIIEELVFLRMLVIFLLFYECILRIITMQTIIILFVFLYLPFVFKNM